MPGKKYASLKKPAVYEKLREERGLSKESAARISNAQAAKDKGGKGGKR